MDDSSARTSDAVYYDGRSARPNRIHVDLGNPEILRVVGTDGTDLAVWPRADLRMVDAPPGILRIRLEPDDGARLEVTDAMLAQDVVVSSPFLTRKASLEKEARRKIVLWSLAACLSVVLLAVYGIPALAERLVPMIPQAVDQQLGASLKPSLIAQLSGGRACEPAPAAEAAFKKMTERLQAESGLAETVDVTIIPSVLPNAFALPGSHVILLSNLIEKAENGDEVAAVIAHEFGHVAKRHSMRKLAGEAGLYILLGAVLGDFTGSTVIIAGSRAVLSAGYSRDAEREADAYAIDLMTRAGGDPAALAHILERISTGSPGGALTLLSTHPDTNERVDEILSRTDATSDSQVLTPAEWQAMKAYCAKTSS